MIQFLKKDSKLRNSFQEQKRTPKLVVDRKNDTPMQYGLDEVTSAIQKYIRRGEKNKLFPFVAIYHKMEGCFAHKLLERILVIASEDVGIASLDILPYFAKIFKKIIDIRKSKERKKLLTKEVDDLMEINSNELLRLFLTSSKYLCESQKDRSVDHAIYPLITRKNGLIYGDSRKRYSKKELMKGFLKCINVNDEMGAIYYAGRMYFSKHIYKNNCDSNDKSDIVYFVFDVLFKKYQRSISKHDDSGIIMKNLTALYEIFHFFHGLKSRHRPELLQLVHSILLIVNYKVILKHCKRTKIITMSDEEMKEIESKMELSEVDDCVIDKHTKKGKVLKRGFKHFADEGALLVNKISWREDVYFKQWRELLISDGK